MEPEMSFTIENKYERHTSTAIERKLGDMLNVNQRVFVLWIIMNSGVCLTCITFKYVRRTQSTHAFIVLDFDATMIRSIYE